MERIVKRTIFFVVLVLLQAVLFSNIDYFGFICPYIYIIFILSLPIGYNKYYALLIAAFLGFLIDMFSNTPGVHMAATVAVAFFRDYWISSILPHTEMGEVEPSLKKLGTANFFKYATGLVFFHHFILFTAEAWTFTAYWFTLLKIIANSVVTMLLISCYYLVAKR